MLQRMQPPIDGRRGTLPLALVLNELHHVTPGDGTGVLIGQPEKEPEIPPVIVNGMGRIVPPVQIGTEVGDGHGLHRLLSSEGMALRDGGHGLLILLSFRRIVELGIAERLVQRVMAEQLFQHFQRYPRVEEVGRKGMPPMSFKT